MDTFFNKVKNIFTNSDNSQTSKIPKIRKNPENPENPENPVNPENYENYENYEDCQNCENYENYENENYENENYENENYENENYENENYKNLNAKQTEHRQLFETITSIVIAAIVLACLVAVRISSDEKIKLLSERFVKFVLPVIGILLFVLSIVYKSAPYTTVSVMLIVAYVFYLTPAGKPTELVKNIKNKASELSEKYKKKPDNESQQQTPSVASGNTKADSIANFGFNFY